MAKSVKVIAPNDQEWRFIREYVVDLDPQRAGVAAGYSPSMAASKCYQWVSAGKANPKPYVYEAAQALLREMAAKNAPANALTKEAIIAELQAIAFADPRDLIELRRVACRYCHSCNGEAQETKAEHKTRLQAHNMLLARTPESKWRTLPPFVDMGGTYDPRMAPNPDCDQCAGDGDERITAKDNRLLSPSARALLAGVKITAQGLEVKMHDKTKALDLLGRHLAMFTDKHVNLNLNVDAKDLPDNAIDASVAYVRMMGGR